MYSSDLGGQGGGFDTEKNTFLQGDNGGNGLAVWSYDKVKNTKAYTYSGRYTKKFPKSNDVDDVIVHAWGAGGAGSRTSTDTTTSPGGGGGYVTCTVALPYDRIMYLTVGGGGRVGTTFNTISRDAYGGGGR